MHRFFLTEQQLHPGHEVDISSISSQLSNVLRLQPGERILLLDGLGHGYITEVLSLDRRRAAGLVLDCRAIKTEPRLFVTLFQCSLKADRFEWVLQKGTELGVARFVPVISQRSVVRPAGALLRKYRRWQAIVREAAEQCGRGRLPELAPPVEWPDALAQGEGLRLLPWEGRANQGSGSCLDGVLASDLLDRVSLLIGPEGGIGPEEVEQATAAGWKIVSLGARVLRAETAALAALTMVLFRSGDLG
jgi:16S rRNA (uracil1498-N3)-methyltransferase